ncbi:hypothetical protein H6P81_010339 [Aristolochia fimbriata]|uniref:Protein FAR1-RELATED SEQUENCE n=1 Tax=Aristolochia fimbriata TaxID=158543 RepID=A0AAV7EP93_ARIFI|nr:hypothetical protein H6P81_010339 [Aristolochia fimbriata]
MMELGAAGAILEYFQKLPVENPSFYFFVFQFDIDDLMTNIFWADARMIEDYDHFGDVITFDTTYRTNDHERQLALFLGVNHHNQTTVFGAALILDSIRFLEHFQMVVDDRRYSETMEDFRTTNSTPEVIVKCEILKAVVTEYTPTIFCIFQDQFESSIFQVLTLKRDEGCIRVYEVGTSKGAWHTITYDSLEGNFTCSCCMFEYLGVQCAHVMKVHVHKEILCMHPKYILKRWTRDAKMGDIVDSTGNIVDVDPKALQTRRYAILMSVYGKVANIASEHDKVFKDCYSREIRMTQEVMHEIKSLGVKMPNPAPQSGASENVNEVHGQTSSTQQ